MNALQNATSHYARKLVRMTVSRHHAPPPASSVERERATFSRFGGFAGIDDLLDPAEKSIFSVGMA